MPATVWKGYLSFGLVSFPIRLSAAARGETVHFHLLHKKDLSRVKEVMYCAAEDKPLERSDLVKGFEYSKGEYIVVEPEELEKVAPPTATTMQILQFVRIDEVDPIFLEKSYYADHAGIFHLRPVQADQDHVTLRSIDIVKYAENFDVHRLRFHALKDGIGNAAHARMDLTYGNGGLGTLSQDKDRR